MVGRGETASFGAEAEGAADSASELLGCNGYAMNWNNTAMEFTSMLLRYGCMTNSSLGC